MFHSFIYAFISQSDFQIVEALSNAGGAISDIWNARERGLASAIYATVPFLGPGTLSGLLHRISEVNPFTVTGPIVGGFVAEDPKLGWHFNFWLIFIFSTITLSLGYCLTPETVCHIPVHSSKV